MKIRQVMHRLYFARSGSFTLVANDNTPGEGNSDRVLAPRSPARASRQYEMAVFPRRGGTSVLCADAALFRWRAVGRAARPIRSGWRASLWIQRYVRFGS